MRNERKEKMMPDRTSNPAMTCPWCQLMLAPIESAGWQCVNRGCVAYLDRYVNDVAVATIKLRVHNEAIEKAREGKL